MSYPAISLATATVGRHRCPQKRLQTARQPPVYPNSSPDHRACNSLTPFRCPHAVHPCPSVDSGVEVEIDWVNFIRFSGITYVASEHSVEERLLGPVFAEVEFRLSGNVKSRGYRSKDGDAAFVNSGSPVYTVKGYQPEFRLAARDLRGELMLYEAFTNPRAETGGDLLDIDGKVRYMGVNSEEDGTTELAAIRNAEQVDALVDMVVEAPVEGVNWSCEGSTYFLDFHLNDSTVVTRGYCGSSGLLSRGIMLPETFQSAVEQALSDSK